MQVAGNLAGEKTVSDSDLIWMTKTHWPMWSPLGVDKFPAEKCFCIVRNPIDVFPSMAGLFLTSSHSLQLETPINELDPVFWNAFVKKLSWGINDSLVKMRTLLEN